MADEKIEIIVVGGGLAGLTAAYVLAREGVEVLLIERGSYCGAKNVTGGKLCAHSIEKVFPDFAEIAPVERQIVREQVFKWPDGDMVGIYADVPGAAAPSGKAYSVLRANLDAWFGEQLENEGAMVVQNICVTGLVVRDGRVCGVETGDETMEADVVILADGVNSLLAQSIGMRPELDPKHTCVGVKEVIALDEETVSKRFGLADGEGAELMYMGDRKKGYYADGFVYANRDSVSIGIEFLTDDISRTDKSVSELLDDFKECSGVAELIEGGRLLEYSAHLVHHGGARELGKLYGDGVLLAGDAGGLVANYGFAVRGMDLAVESGRLAAETVLASREKGDFSAEALSNYQRAVEESFIAADMRACESWMENELKGE